MNIRIEGDSWGVGCWGYYKSKYTVYHNGIQEYLERDGHNVFNNSRPGRGIAEFFDIPIDNEEIAIVFQSDPLRDNLDYIKNKVTTYDELLELHTQDLKNFYKRISLVNVPILLLGGATSLILEEINKYPNLHPVIPSITEFIYPDYKHPEIWFSNWLESVDRNYSLEELDKLLYVKKIQDELSEFKYSKYFYPDGFHPNHEGQKLVYKKINEYINTYIK